MCPILYSFENLRSGPVSEHVERRLRDEVRRDGVKAEAVGH